jgi:hypothetical protein
MVTYNRQISKLQQHCTAENISFPPNDTAAIADFLCQVASESDRPKSILNCSTAAMTCLYGAMNKHNPVHTMDISKLLTALVKSQTKIARVKSPVMPVVAFSNFFSQWPNNGSLSIKQLRLKAVTLFALTFMLRPSDVAPKAIFMDDKLECHHLVFALNNIVFHDSGHMSVTFHGGKNDYHRDGFTIKIPPASDKQLDPVSTIRDYMTRTGLQRLTSLDQAVFLTLVKPYHGLSSTGIASVLQEAIGLVGLAGQGFTAKSFRPTGATHAVATGCDSNVARQVGRWKSHSVFEEHYVHVNVPEKFVDNLVS